MAQPGIRLHGLRELQSALKRYNRDALKKLDKTLLEAARIVSDDAAQKFTAVDTRTASGFRPRVRGFGRVVVEQRLGRTTGLRPDFGSLQMRTALLPALYDNQEKVIEALDFMLDEAALRERLL